MFGGDGPWRRRTGAADHRVAWLRREANLSLSNGELWQVIDLNGAPRPMKMGTIVSPWRYDAIVDHTLEPTYLRWLAILRYAPSTVIVRVRADPSKASSGVPSGPGFANLGLPFAGPP